MFYQKVIYTALSQYILQERCFYEKQKFGKFQNLVTLAMTMSLLCRDVLAPPKRLLLTARLLGASPEGEPIFCRSLVVFGAIFRADRITDTDGRNDGQT